MKRQKLSFHQQISVDTILDLKTCQWGMWYVFAKRKSWFEVVELWETMVMTVVCHITL